MRAGRSAVQERLGGGGRIAKADLVPTDHNQLDAYASFAELEAACAVFCERVYTRGHRITRRAPALVDERVWARADGRARRGACRQREWTASQ
jgi:hypothetical protein